MTGDETKAGTALVSGPVPGTAAASITEPFTLSESLEPALDLTVIIPAWNASSTLRPCLESVCCQLGRDTEVIVVDDGSTDGTSSIAAEFPVKLLTMASRGGAAAARNRGAEFARAPLLMFLDADTVAEPDLLARGCHVLKDPDVDAVIGSYDDRPASRSTVSLFKNLMHHHFHQRARGPATTFWGGCGLIRKELFERVGGFDEKRYVESSIEDVELGLRMIDNGARILVDPSLRVKHLKCWTMRTLIATDVSRRAIPWTLLALGRRRMPDDLNLSRDQRWAAVVTVCMAATFVGGFMWRPAWALFAALMLFAFWINRRLYGLFLRQGGVRLALCGFPLQQFYYLYALCGVAAGIVLHIGRGTGAVDGPDTAAKPP